MVGQSSDRRDAPMVMSLRTMLEYAKDADSGEKRVSGNVRSFAEVFESATLSELDRQHSGVYAFLLFHPKADAAVAEYLSTGALASDSGPRILTFFTLDTEARAPLVLPASHTPRLDFDVHPAYEIVRALFDPKPPPGLPGLLFMGGLGIEEDCVYAALGELGNVAAARTQIAKVLALADRAVGKQVKRDKFTNDLAVVLRREGVGYKRSGRTSVREFLISAFRVVTRHRGDIVTGIKLATGKR